MALPIFQRTVVDDEGNIVAGATVTVLRESTGLAANIYSDRAGSAALSNPFTTGSDGLARFYAAPGEYRIQVSGPSTSADWRYQILGGTAAAYDVTESTTDTSLGGNGQPRVMRVGDGGLLKDWNNSEIAGDLLSLDIPNGVVLSYTVGTLNSPRVGEMGNYGTFYLSKRRAVDEQRTIICIESLSGAIYRRSVSNASDTGWQEILHTGNMVGTVSQSGGSPTGAIIERGSNANGEYVKFADGTLICWINSITFPYVNASTLYGTWTFPHAFSQTSRCLTGFPASISGFLNCSPSDCGVTIDGGGTTSAVVGVRSSATGVFASNASLSGCFVKAVGRWY